MIDATTYLKIVSRMTKGCSQDRNCLECVLDTDNNPYKIDCRTFELQHPEEAVEAVEKWAEEHPVKTKMGDFLEKFPRARVLENGHGEYIDICPVTIDTTRACPSGACNNCMQEYWNEEVKE